VTVTSTVFARAAKGCRVAIGAAIAVAALALVAGPAAAAAPPVYSSIPTTLPGNVWSVGFEATSTSQLGDYIALAGTERSSENLPVTVVMSIWACQEGGWTGADCTTTPGATWAQPLTLTIYKVDHSAAIPAAGEVVLTTTQTFDLPYRPSYDPNGPCKALESTGWYSTTENHCYNGLAHEVTFTLPGGKTLPDELIWSISYNTGSHGFPPIGKTGPYDSLNVGTQTFDGQPSYGSDVEPDAIFQSSTWDKAYGDGGATGTFRDDTAGWADYKPLVCFGAACPLSDPLATPTPPATVAPSQVVGGVTATQRTTPPPTNTDGSTNGGSGSTIALLICSAFAAAALIAAATQRRAARRR
jgi:hypothetical protein